VELQNLLNYKTMEFLPVWDTRWHGNVLVPVLVLTVERLDGEGNHVKFKARVCARGDRTPHPGAQHTSSPVVHQYSINLLLNLYVSRLAEGQRVGITVFDVVSAYLEVAMKEEVFVRLNPRIANLLIELVPELVQEGRIQPDGTIIAKLLKCLYGLRQSGKRWYQMISGIFELFGLLPSRRDKALFIKGSGNSQLVVGIHVDDGLCVGPYPDRVELIAHLTGELTKIKYSHDQFSFSLLGKVHTQVFDKSGKITGILITLPHYEDELVMDFLGDEELTVRTINNPFYKTFHEDDDTLLLSDQIELIRNGIARLGYLAQQVRLDIRCAVSFLQVSQHKPTRFDWRAFLHLVKYLRSNPHLGGMISPSDLQLRNSADAGHLSHANGRGHSGGVLWFGKTNFPIAVFCGKNEIMACNSMEAELIALARMSKWITTILDLCDQLGMKQTHLPLVEQDNASLIMCVESGTYDASTKHLNMRFQTVLQQVGDGVFGLEKVDSALVLANGFTKAQLNEFPAFRARILNMTEVE
jgi:hypothetical protein